MNLFITGGTGFIGSNFINEAILSGFTVRALKREGSEPRVPLIQEPEWVIGDLKDPQPKWFSETQVFIHLASHTPNPPYASLSECLYWNVFVPIKCAEMANNAGVNKFIVAGSMFEYGLSWMTHECLDIYAPLKPNNSYATSKASASVAFEGFSREKKIQLKLLRFFQVFGEGEQSNRFWPSLRAAAIAGDDFPMSHGQQIRDFINVSDLSKTLVRELDFEAMEDGVPIVKNISMGDVKTLLEFAEYWWKTFNAKGALRPGMMPYRKDELMRLIAN
jgi:nucleoside-diphosphate-sugar epimerase